MLVCRGKQPLGTWVRFWPWEVMTVLASTTSKSTSASFLQEGRYGNMIYQASWIQRILLTTGMDSVHQWTEAEFWSDEPKTETTVEQGASTTIMQAEVYAIWVCAKHISIYIYQYSMRLYRSKLVRDCIQLVEQILGGNVVKLVWIPSHCASQGNERADKLSKSHKNKLRICLILASNDFIKVSLKSII